ncbi:hypothetical protein GEMRC1_006251 [Eukaryota sp. GEM-RC1]
MASKQIVFFSQQFPQVFDQQSTSGKDSWVQFPGVSGACNLRIVKYPSQFLFEFAPPSAPEQVLLSAPCQLAYLQSPANLVLRDPTKQKRIWVRFPDPSQDKTIFSFINQAQNLAKAMPAAQQQPSFQQHNAHTSVTSNVGNLNISKPHSFDYIALEVQPTDPRALELVELPSEFKPISPTLTSPMTFQLNNI